MTLANRRGKVGKGGGAVWLWVLVLLASAVELRAHAVLLHTEPLANVRLESAPPQITLIFNERVEPVFNSVRVLDAQGGRHDQGEVRVEDGDTVVVSLKQIDEGGYGVFWRVNSLDGHQVQGQFGFGYRAAPPTEEELARQGPGANELLAKWYLPVCKGLGLVGLALWLGGIGFVAIVARPVRGLTPHTENPAYFAEVFRVSAIAMLIGGILFVLSEFGTLFGKTAMLIGIPLPQAVSLNALQAVLRTTSLGEWWLIRYVIAAALLIVTARVLQPEFVENRWGAGWTTCFALLGGAIVTTIAATGHARAVSDGVLAAQAVDWIHLTATTIWLGGLFHFLSAIWLSRKHGPDTLPVVNLLTPRFSRLAQVCVLALIATGIYNTWLHLPSWSSFLSSDYGKVLTAKLGLVFGILVIAAINRQRALPAMTALAQAPERAFRWAARLRKLVGAEVMIGALILATVAVLTNLPPATTVAGGAADLQQRSGEYLIRLRLEPNRVGKNQAIVQIGDSKGERVSDARRVTVYLRSLDMDMGLETVQASPAPYGSFLADVTLSMAGRWLVSVEISPPSGDTFVTEFNLTSSM